MEVTSKIENLSFANIYSSKISELKRTWQKTNCKYSLVFILNLLVVCDFILSLCLFLVILLFFDFETTIASIVIIFCSVLLIGYKIPQIFAKRYAMEIESDLHLVLRAFSLYISIKWPYEKIISKMAESNYKSSELFANAKKFIQSSKSVPQALHSCSQQCDSILFARAMQAISLTYQTGGEHISLDYLADEIVQTQTAEVKMQASKSALFGLVFVVVSSLLPAFFLILNVSAGPFIGISPSVFDIWFFYVVLLPLIVVTALLVMFLSSPTILGSINMINLQKQVNKIISDKQFGFILGPYFESKILSDIKADETELSNMLLAGASTEKFSIEHMLESGKKSTSKNLSQQCTQILHQIKAGANPQTVLKKWMEQTPSIMLSRALVLVLVGYETGASLQKALHTASNDLMSAFNLVRERASLLSMQIYTLMASSAFLIPAILATAISFSSQIADLSSGYYTAGFANIDTNAFDNLDDLINASRGAIQIYLIINSILTAFFISTMSGSRHKFLQYTILIGVASQVVWYVIGASV